MESNDFTIMLFDGVCNLCNALVKFIIKHDRGRRIKFAPLQSQFSQDLLLNWKMDPATADSVVYVSSDKYFIKSAAILKMFRDMGRAWKTLYLLMIIPRFIRDYVYDVVARNRYRIFGKQDSCMIPTPEIKERFLG